MAMSKQNRTRRTRLRHRAIVGRAMAITALASVMGIITLGVSLTYDWYVAQPATNETGTPKSRRVMVVNLDELEREHLFD